MVDSPPSDDVEFCWEYYTSRRFNADPSTPIDRWAQAKDTRDLGEVLENIGPLVETYQVTTLVEPFTGLGSGALAARHLRLDYYGCEISPTRAGRAMTKAFLTLPLLEDVVAGRDCPPGDAGSAAVGLPLRAATRDLIDHLAARHGSVTEALSIMRSDLAAAPPPCRGEILAGDFHRLRPEPGPDDAVLYLLCPPFPRFRSGDAVRDPADDVGHCRTPDQFEVLIGQTAAWLRDHLRPQDVVISEYFNFLADYDTGTRLARLLSQAVPFVRVVAASPVDQRGAEVAHRTGYCGFVLGSLTHAPQVPRQWSGA